MNEKQKRFVDVFIETGDTLEAATRAGYSRTYAQNVKMQPGVKAYIAQRIAEAVVTRMTSSDDMLEYYADQIRKDGGVTFHIKSVEQLAKYMGYYGTTDQIRELRAMCRAYLGIVTGETGYVESRALTNRQLGDSGHNKPRRGRHAHWILHPELDFGCPDKECSNCGKASLICSNYCHCCGCRMDEPSTECGNWDDD
jgi:hypothetical protein